MDLYESNDFWDKFYIQYLETVCFLRKIDFSKDELEDFVIEKEYLNKESNNFFGSYIKKIINVLQYFRLLVLKGVELKRGNNSWPYINIKELRELYLKFDPDGTYLSFFDEKNKNSFQKLYEKICKKTENIKNLYDLCEKTAFCFIGMLASKPLGEFTYEFSWLMLQSIFIFKQFGVLLFYDNYDIKLMNDSINNLIKKYEISSDQEWTTSPEFMQVCHSFETISETWLEKQYKTK